jgi:hypothetical protein
MVQSVKMTSYLILLNELLMSNTSVYFIHSDTFAGSTVKQLLFLNVFQVFHCNILCNLCTTSQEMDGLYLYMQYWKTFAISQR